MIELIELVVALIVGILIPIVRYQFNQNTRITVLEQKCEDRYNNYADNKQQQNEQIAVLFDKIDLLHKDIRALTIELVKQNQK